MSVMIVVEEGQQGRQQVEGNWVSGTVASLAISTPANIVFDLGPGWRNQRSAVISGSGMADSTGSTVTAVFSSDPAGSVLPAPAMTPNSTSGRLVYNGALSAFVAQLLVVDRYLRVTVNNGSSAAQPATARLRLVSHDL